MEFENQGTILWRSNRGMCERLHTVIRRAESKEREKKMTKVPALGNLKPLDEVTMMMTMVMMMGQKRVFGFQARRFLSLLAPRLLV